MIIDQRYFMPPWIPAKERYKFEICKSTNFLSDDYKIVFEGKIE